MRHMEHHIYVLHYTSHASGSNNNDVLNSYVPI